MEFSNYLVQICDFLEQTLLIEGFHDHVRLLNICALMLDMTKLSPGNNKQLKVYMTKPYIQNMLEALSKVNDEECQ
jgi:hypothetical protein